MADRDLKRENTGLGLVLGGIAVLSIVLGVAAYWRYASSEKYVKEGMEQMDQIGPTLDAEECVDRVLEWSSLCDANGTNAAVCQQAVPILMFHCLDGRDRTEECAAYKEPRESGKWVQEVCDDKGMHCQNKRECPCADAYRGLESFCLNDGEAVQL